MAKLTDKDIAHVAKLANLPLEKSEIKKFKEQLSEVISYIDELSKIDTATLQPTSQTTRLTNVYRKDKVESLDILSQEEALSQTESTHNGYFEVSAILNKDG
jgi:aspartyl-tRNA(Asn)/glutamyl-tRNA(Gln) amidotransferase subunit C